MRKQDTRKKIPWHIYIYGFKISSRQAHTHNQRSKGGTTENTYVTIENKDKLLLMTSTKQQGAIPIWKDTICH